MARNTNGLMGIPDELCHWVPGEMVVVVQLPQHRADADDTLDLLVEQVQSQLNSCLKPYHLALEAYGTSGRWSEVPSMPPIRRRAFLFGRKRQQPLLAIFFHVRESSPAGTGNGDPMPNAISYIQRQLEQLAQVGLHVVSAMPNWLVTAAPLYYGDGGPAMPPRPAPKLDFASTEGGAPQGWHISLLDQAGLLNPGGAEDIVVAVLDTAPHPDRLRGAVSRPEYRRNWLLQRLVSDLKSEKRLFDIEYERRYYVTNDVRTGRNAAGASRYYLMPDHGLFIAGLVRDVAPSARIQLIRILNDYGGCDLYNLFAALTDLEYELASNSMRRLVVNLSLTVMPDIRRLPQIWFEPNRQWKNTQLVGVMRMLSYLEEGLRLLFESLHAQGALIVVAAGNDSLLATRENQRPHPPRTPARYPSTLCVTSVNHRFGPSLFANAACMPPLNAGVATFGGDLSGAKDEHGWPDMVRGVYISSNFPEGEQNTSGWADWCGTSFSAPIISALGAHLLAQGWSATQAMTRLTTGQRTRGNEKLFGTAHDVPSLLANVIRVQQRFEAK